MTIASGGLKASFWGRPRFSAQIFLTDKLHPAGIEVLADGGGMEEGRSPTGDPDPYRHGKFHKTAFVQN